MTKKFPQKKFANQIYNQDVAGLVIQAFEGVKITVFAYGQTGSGKTFTMMGSGQSPGLYTMTVEDIFARKMQSQRIHVSFYEIYCSQLYDLLHERAKLILREDGDGNINVVGIMQIEVCSPDELLQCIEKGNEQRITSSTSANYDSSRSHSILQIRIIEDNLEVGKLCFIDLAGNERGADTYDNDKQTRVDGAEINKSLLALKECIRALDQRGKHTPFRGSKLTLVLKDSFIGNCRTMMIANISPSSSSCENTLNTLRYADRVKELSGPKSGSTSGKREDGVSNKLMLPRLDKKKQMGSIEIPEKRKGEGIPKTEKPPRPVENKPLHSNQEIDKSPNITNPSFSSNNNLRNPKSGSQVVKPVQRQRSDSAHKNKWSENSSSHDVKRQLENKSKLVRMSEDDNQFMPENLKMGAKKRLTPIPLKPLNTSSKKNNSMLPKKQPVQFAIIGKFFKRPVDSYSKTELKDLHLEIIDDMIVFEENFLTDHRDYSNNLQDCIKRQRRIVDRFEDPSHEIDPYLNETEKLLELELETTNALRTKLEVFKKYLAEENAFAKKYICEDKSRGQYSGDGYEIKSHDSLLLDD